MSHVAKYIVQPVAEDGGLLEKVPVDATTPRHAAETVVGKTLATGQTGFNGVLRAKVYVTVDGVTTLKRFYER